MHSLRTTDMQDLKTRQPIPFKATMKNFTNKGIEIEMD